MKTLNVVLIASSLFLLPLVSFAHGGGDHIKGTLSATDESSLTVATVDKKQVRVTVDASTKFEKAGAPATQGDLTVGERVVVHTATADKSGQARAVLVKFGIPRTAGRSPHRSRARRACARSYWRRSSELVISESSPLPSALSAA